MKKDQAKHPARHGDAKQQPRAVDPTEGEAVPLKGRAPRHEDKKSSPQGGTKDLFKKNM
jgi:hypothetical protein